MRAAGKRERLLFLFIFIALLAVLALLFGPYVSEYFLKPLSQGLWLLLRIFVLSIDQRVLWGLMIFAVAIFFLVRPNRIPRPLYEEAESTRNAALRELERWRYLFADKPGSAREFGSLQRELAWTLCAVYASRKRIRADYEVRDAFAQRKIPLDEGIYAFLFAEAPAKLRKLRRSKYDRDVEAYLDYSESQLEMRDDDE
jgi:hypothetical protein